jgi:peptidoglycan/LPS O-acetylase OafA/YrhL
MGTIRLLLALSVLIVHSAPVFGVMLLSGDMAITAFFMVSGFLMALILETKYVGRVRAFYLNRILRIYPPYFVALAGSIVFFVLVTGNRWYDPVKVMRWFAEAEAWGAMAWTAVTNLTLIGINLVRYVNPDEAGRLYINVFEKGGFPGHNILFVPQAWTLGLELYYYAIVPFVVLLRTRYIAAITIALFFLNHKARLYIASQGIEFFPDASFAYQLKYFLLGTLGFRFVGPLRMLAERYSAFRLLPAMSLAAAFVLIAGGLPAYYTWFFDMDWFYLAFALCIPGIFIVSSNWKFDAALGEYSYPVYLFHYPVTIGVYMWLPTEWHGEFTLTITMLLATAYIQLIDKRIQAVRKDIARGRVRPAPPIAEAAE